MALPNQAAKIANQKQRRTTSKTKTKRRGNHQSQITTNQIYCVDACEGLQQLPDESIDCVVTSPPYWATRDYGVGKTTWPDGLTCALGLEPSYHLFIEHLCSIFDEVKRVLKPTGTLWVNMGDTYHTATKRAHAAHLPQSICDGNHRDYQKGRPKNQGLPKKCLMQIPARFAIEMTNRGWALRNDIVWHKPNHMPASVKDRLACAWEHLFLFTKSKKYYFDLDAIRLPHRSKPKNNFTTGKHANVKPSHHLDGRRNGPPSGSSQSFHSRGKNPGDVWHINTQGTAWAHFAMFPEKLVTQPILAGCPQRVCKRCGTPQLARSISDNGNGSRKHEDFNAVERFMGCNCRRGFNPGIVLDPFMGAGTTAVVAKRLGRQFVGFELNPKYVAMAEKRLAGD